MDQEIQGTGDSFQKWAGKFPKYFFVEVALT